jgi:Fe-S oxidoreductase
LLSAAGAVRWSPGTTKNVVFTPAKKIDQIKGTGAGMLVVPCHSCHGQFNNIKKEYGMADLEVKYLWELVADCLVL